MVSYIWPFPSVQSLLLYDPLDMVDVYWNLASENESCHGHYMRRDINYNHYLKCSILAIFVVTIMKPSFETFLPIISKDHMLFICRLYHYPYVWTPLCYNAVPFARFTKCLVILWYSAVPELFHIYRLVVPCKQFYSGKHFWFQDLLFSTELMFPLQNWWGYLQRCFVFTFRHSG